MDPDQAISPSSQKKYSRDVSIITPVFNGALFLDEYFQGIFDQSCLKSLRSADDTEREDSEASCLTEDIKEKKKPKVHDIGILKQFLSVEVCIFNDASTDHTEEIILKWKEKLLEKDVHVTYIKNETGYNLGVGAAKNRAVEESVGEFLCFQDADDIMEPHRILYQFNEINAYSNCHKIIMGSKFKRTPDTATPRYTDWLNNMSPNQLLHQVYRECTILMPTWFMSHQNFLEIGKFNEDEKENLMKKKRIPEDYQFLHRHLEKGGDIKRCDHILLTYRYHPNCISLGVDEELIYEIKLKYFQRQVLDKWDSFGIWSLGKEGKRLYRRLDPHNRDKVEAFYDIDPKKIERGYFFVKEFPRRIPILHFSAAKGKKFATCVKYKLTENNEFERNVESLDMTEGKDFFFFM